MTDAASASRANPWLTLWLRPRAAIEAVLAADWRTTSLGLALAAGVFQVIVAIPEAPAFFLEAPRRGLLPLAAAMLCGMILLAAFVYYFDNWVLNLIARALGGKGVAAGTRAASAWSAVPLLVADAVVFALGAAAPGRFATVALAVAAISSFWSFILFVVMLARVQAFGKVRATVSLLIGSLAPALLIAVVVRSLLFQPFNIPSGSMAPTLLVGDYMFAAKADYGYSRYSFPFDIVPLEGRWLAHPPKRGDVVVFRHEEADYVKRIVALPGEKVQLLKSRLYINGEVVQRRPVEPSFVMPDLNGKPQTAATYDEILPGAAPHRIIQLAGDEGQNANTDVLEVPAGAYFVLGDNRDNSYDSRFPNFGFVPFENLIGRADWIYFSRAEDKTVRVERMGTAVK
jgi:signal peptidase I